MFCAPDSGNTGAYIKRSRPLAGDLAITGTHVRAVFVAPAPGLPVLNPEVAVPPEADYSHFFFYWMGVPVALGVGSARSLWRWALLLSSYRPQLQSPSSGWDDLCRIWEFIVIARARCVARSEAVIQ